VLPFFLPTAKSIVMQVAIIGYGKMGKEIESVCRERGHEIALIIDADNMADLTPDNLKNVDVAIEFSTPATAYTNVLSCLDAGIPVVVGTTGWLDKYNEAIRVCQKKKGAMFYASNYSIGVNLFFKLNTELARIMNHQNAYEIGMREVHHITKKDSPSGTAITLADDIIKNVERKKTWKLGASSNEIIGIQAVREGTVPGIHTVHYESDVDIIEITHNAKTRRGFAQGAVLAAEFIVGKSGIFGMKDLLNF
jgi:4-hydroxy-tetrahydrodipicolinate reductase